MHANGILNNHRLPFSIVHRCMEVVDLAQAITAEDKTVCKHPNANLARIKDILPVVRWGGITVGHKHLREGRAVDDGAKAALAEVLQQVQHQSLAWGEANAKTPLLPAHMVALYLETRSFRLC